MDQLSHNQVIRITTGPLMGIYRVIFDEPRRNRTVVVCIAGGSPRHPENAPNDDSDRPSPRPKRKKPLPLIGALRWLDRQQLEELELALDLIRVDVEPEAIYLSPVTGAKNVALFERRKAAMAGFLDFERLYEGIVVHSGLGGLVRAAMQTTNVNRHFVYKCWSLLCRFGILESSLRPRLDRCGAPNVQRPSDPGGRRKAGRKTTAQRIATHSGTILPPTQPGMNTNWRALIMAADKGIPSPKPMMPARCDLILSSHFVRRFRFEGDRLVEVELKKGEYPNRKQISRVLNVEISRLEGLLQKTTQGHYARNLRGAGGSSWRGVAGPGHTWAIDSTIGDIYLRSSLNRAWIIGRPIAYVIVDVWSTAVVGFYVCLEGPSWAMAKLSILSAGAAPAFVADLWGYQPILSLMPVPTLCAALLCDRGEYLSRQARETGKRLLPILSYAPPYRPDYKGIVEVLHRVEKDKQYHFVPGAIDARRQEYELRRFNPDDAALTVREYVHYLYSVFTEYNLTADRQRRLDAHMQADGVFPSPAGLWRWGHAVGIGFRRQVPTAELISELMPAGDARITRSGVHFGQRAYGSPEVEQRKWIDAARNFGGWDLPCHYFPGSVGKIWTPDIGGSGMLELQLSEQSTASPELTFDEVADALMYSRCNRADIEHQQTILRLEQQKLRQGIVEAAKALNAETNARESVARPTLTESRQLEIAANSHQLAVSAPVVAHPDVAPATEEGEESYLVSMREILGTLNEREDQDADV